MDRTTLGLAVVLLYGLIMVWGLSAVESSESDETIRVRTRRSRTWQFQDLLKKCSTHKECKFTGFCSSSRGKCCSPHGYACFTAYDCCKKGHICGGKYAKYCKNPMPVHG